MPVSAARAIDAVALTWTAFHSSIKVQRAIERFASSHPKLAIRNDAGQKPLLS